MEYEIIVTGKFKRDYKLAVKRGYNIMLLENVVDTLAGGEKLADKYQDHPLSGNYAGYRECHITSDWLLIYALDGKELTLCLMRTGTHSDLF